MDSLFGNLGHQFHGTWIQFKIAWIEDEKAWIKHVIAWIKQETPWIKSHESFKWTFSKRILLAKILSFIGNYEFLLAISRISF